MYYYAAVGFWGLVLGVRNSGPSPGFRGAIVIAVVASIVQGAFGLLVLGLSAPPRELLHILYGFAVVLAMIALLGRDLEDRLPRRRRAPARAEARSSQPVAA